MKRCSRCIIPETAKGIILDDDGLCQLCRNYKEFIPKGEEALRSEINGNINNGANYNCVVPVSGGRDSSYALYYAKEILGLKPLAVHNDNDFETPIASKNLETITKSLKIPLVLVKSQKHLTKKVVAEKLKINVPFGPGLIVDQTCEACKYGFESASYKTARKENIKLVIWGDSKDESTEPYHVLIKQEHKTPTKWQRITSHTVVNFLKFKYYFMMLKKEYGSDSSEGLKDIHLYDFVRWDRKVIVDTITKEMGWSTSDDSPTSWRIDCSLVPLVNYLTEKAYGVSKIELGFSNMVRNGKMNRDDALKQVDQIKGKTNIEEFKVFLKDIGLSCRIANQILLIKS